MKKIIINLIYLLLIMAIVYIIFNITNIIIVDFFDMPRDFSGSNDVQNIIKASISLIIFTNYYFYPKIFNENILSNRFNEISLIICLIWLALLDIVNTAHVIKP